MGGDGNGARSLRIMGPDGHGTLEWEPGSDDVMRALIEEKMRQGYRFFVTQPRYMGLAPPRRVPVADVATAMSLRKVSLSDADFAAVVASGHATLRPSAERDGSLDAPERGMSRGDGVLEHDPAVVARSDSFAFRGMAGG